MKDVTMGEAKQEKENENFKNRTNENKLTQKENEKGRKVKIQSENYNNLHDIQTNSSESSTKSVRDKKSNNDWNFQKIPKTEQAETKVCYDRRSNQINHQRRS